MELGLSFFSGMALWSLVQELLGTRFFVAFSVFLDHRKIGA